MSEMVFAEAADEGVRELFRVLPPRSALRCIALATALQAFEASDGAAPIAQRLEQLNSQLGAAGIKEQNKD